MGNKTKNKSIKYVEGFPDVTLEEMANCLSFKVKKSDVFFRLSTNYRSKYWIINFFIVLLFFASPFFLSSYINDDLFYQLIVIGAIGLFFFLVFICANYGALIINKESNTVKFYDFFFYPRFKKYGFQEVKKVLIVVDEVNTTDFRTDIRQASFFVILNNEKKKKVLAFSEQITRDDYFSNFIHRVKKNIEKMIDVEVVVEDYYKYYDRRDDIQKPMW